MLYGRDAEMRDLDRYVEEFQAGAGRVLWLVGEAGLGKTALVQYLKEAAARRGIECLIRTMSRSRWRHGRGRICT